MENFVSQYKYTCELELVGNIEEALKTYLSKEEFINWHEDLIRVDDTDKDNEYYLVYLINNLEMKMKVTEVEFLPPHYAKTIYEMPGVWNLCVDRFEKRGDNILWTMDVEFRFEEEQHLLIDAFIRKTFAGMNVFKYYFENKM